MCLKPYWCVPIPKFKEGQSIVSFRPFLLLLLRTAVTLVKGKKKNQSCGLFTLWTCVESGARHYPATKWSSCHLSYLQSSKSSQISSVQAPTLAWPSEDFQLEPRHQHAPIYTTKRKREKISQEKIFIFLVCV